MDIYIVDTGSNIIAFARMHGACRGLIFFKIKKSKNFAWFTINTAALIPLIQSG